MKGRVVSIFFLVFLVVPSVATLLFLHQQRVQIRRVIKRQIIAGLDRDELVLLKFAVSEAETELHWEHPGEFEYRGQMYDIVEKEIHGDTIYYWCWWDHEETRVHEKLIKLVVLALGNNAQKKESQKRLVKFYKSLYHSIAVFWQFNVAEPEQNSFIYTFHYSSFNAPPAAPPPKSS